MVVVMDVDDESSPKDRFWRLPDDPAQRAYVLEAVEFHEPSAPVRDLGALGSVIELQSGPARAVARLAGCTPNSFPFRK